MKRGWVLVGLLLASVAWVAPAQVADSSGGGWRAALEEQPAYVAKVRALRRVPAGPLVFRGARLFDAEARTTRPGITVVVEGNRISAVGPDGTVPFPMGAEVIDATGKTLIPGLWDMHAHVMTAFAWEVLNLAAGVTTVREMIADTGAVRQLASRSAEARTFGPRTLWVGFIEGKGGRTASGWTGSLAGAQVGTETEARALVRRYAALGARQVKLYGGLDRALVPAVVDEAHRLGLRVGGHLPPFMTAEQAVRAGYDEISHVAFLAASFLGDTVDWRRGRFVEIARARAADLDLASDSVRRLVRLLKDRGVAVDPTLAILEEPQGTATPPFLATIFDRLPPEARRRWDPGAAPPLDADSARHRASFEQLKSLIGLLHAGGVPLLPGTDEIPGFTLHRELELYVEGGISAADALYLATLGAARIMGMDRELGSVAPGKVADLVLVDGDPTRQISDIRRPVLTVKDGALYDPRALYAALGIRP